MPCSSQLSFLSWPHQTALTATLHRILEILHHGLVILAHWHHPAWSWSTTDESFNDCYALIISLIPSPSIEHCYYCWWDSFLVRMLDRANRPCCFHGGRDSSTTPHSHPHRWPDRALLALNRSELLHWKLLYFLPKPCHSRSSQAPQCADHLQSPVILT